MSNEVVELELFVIASTNGAVLVSEHEPENDKLQETYWLPYSQLNGASEYNVEIGEMHEFTVNEWLANEKGLI